MTEPQSTDGLVKCDMPNYNEIFDFPDYNALEKDGTGSTRTTYKDANLFANYESATITMLTTLGGDWLVQLQAMDDSHKVFLSTHTEGIQCHARQQ